jgi:hypothetical protein
MQQRARKAKPTTAQEDTALRFAALVRELAEAPAPSMGKAERRERRAKMVRCVLSLAQLVNDLGDRSFRHAPGWALTAHEGRALRQLGRHARDVAQAIDLRTARIVDPDHTP